MWITIETLNKMNQHVKYYENTTVTKKILQQETSTKPKLELFKREYAKLEIIKA